MVETIAITREEDTQGPDEGSFTKDPLNGNIDHRIRLLRAIGGLQKDNPNLLVCLTDEEYFAGIFPPDQAMDFIIGRWRRGLPLDRFNVLPTNGVTENK